MSTWVAALLAAAALTATYFCCIRPMRRGTRGMSAAPPSTSRQVADLRKELDALRRQKSAADDAAQARRRGTSGASTPPRGKDGGIDG